MTSTAVRPFAGRSRNGWQSSAFRGSALRLSTTAAWSGQPRGVLEAGHDEVVTAHSVFQAASISKVVAATATLRLADEGKLDLDTDVNHYLRSWKVPENEYTAREKVTLRRLLSHTAGTSVHGFFGYAADEPKPALLDVLDGRPPAKNKPIRVTAVPGSSTRYSGGGVVVEQLVLTDVTGEPFPLLARDLVFAPLRMDDSTFEQPVPDAVRARAARGHDEEGKELPGGWHSGPEMAAGWMWTTATDLMRWAIAVADARDGKVQSILSQKTAKAMLTRQGESYGLGPLLDGSGRAFTFSHGGNNPGYTTQVTYFPETRQGLAILTNKVGADLLIDEITRAIAREYGWPAQQPARLTPIALSASEQSRIAGDYALSTEGSTDAGPATIHAESDRLYLDFGPVTHDEIVAASPSRLVSPEWGYTVDLQRNDRGEVVSFTLKYGDNTMFGRRKG
jgi:CubicO group peptidase (beta-lactamase class C family)